MKVSVSNYNHVLLSNNNITMFWNMIYKNLYTVKEYVIKIINNSKVNNT